VAVKTFVFSSHSLFSHTQNIPQPSISHLKIAISQLQVFSCIFPFEKQDFIHNLRREYCRYFPFSVTLQRETLAPLKTGGSESAHSVGRRSNVVPVFSQDLANSKPYPQYQQELLNK